MGAATSMLYGASNSNSSMVSSDYLTD